jgi:hypothetical protein
MQVGIIDRGEVTTTITNQTAIADLVTGTLGKRALREGGGLKFVFTGLFNNTTGSSPSIYFNMSFDDGSTTQAVGGTYIHIPTGAYGSNGPRYRMEFNIIAATDDLSAGDNAMIETVGLAGDKNGGDSDSRQCLNASAVTLDLDWTKEVDWKLTVTSDTASEDLSIISHFYYVEAM